MSNGKHTVGKNGTAAAARIANLERRLLNSEAAEQRVHSELLKACEGAEAAERNAARIRQLQEPLQVTAYCALIVLGLLRGQGGGGRGC